MPQIIIDAIWTILAVLLGSSFIGAMIRCFKKGNYTGFGFGIMLTLLCCLYMIKTILM